MGEFLGLLLVAGLIAANGIFVASEFSLVAVRRSTVQAQANAGSRRAELVRRELGDLSFALSAAQFGITTTSLLVGYVAERTLGDTLFRPTLRMVGVPEEAALGIAVTGAFLLSTILQMVLGELFPKNLAISRPLDVATWVTPPSRAFARAFSPVIRLLHRAAEVVTERVFGVEARAELETGHSLDELARIVAASGKEGSLTRGQADLLRRAVAMRDRRVSETMVPRPDVAWVERDDTLHDLLTVAARTGHSRFPIRGRDEDDVLGTVHVKNVLDVDEAAHATTPVTSIAVPITAVPESREVRKLLTDLRRGQSTFAIAFDEYGGTVGIITIEDVLEQLVGDIIDEFDRERRGARRVLAGRHLVPGSIHLDEVRLLVDRELPSGDYDTVAGFVLSQLGRLARKGDSVRHGDLRITVTRVQGRRITQVGLEVLDTVAGRGERP